MWSDVHLQSAKSEHRIETLVQLFLIENQPFEMSMYIALNTSGTNMVCCVPNKSFHFFPFHIGKYISSIFLFAH